MTASQKGTIVNEIYKKAEPRTPPAMRLGHPIGKLQVEIEKQNGQLELTKAALARAARLSMAGKVYLR